MSAVCEQYHTSERNTAHELTIIDILADIEFKLGHAFVGAILLIASRLL